MPKRIQPIYDFKQYIQDNEKDVYYLHKDIIPLVARTQNAPISQTENTINRFVEIVEELFARHKKVVLTGIGTFTFTYVKSRWTDENALKFFKEKFADRVAGKKAIRGYYKPSFKISKDLAKRINPKPKSKKKPQGTTTTDKDAEPDNPPLSV